MCAERAVDAMGCGVVMVDGDVVAMAMGDSDGEWWYVVGDWHRYIFQSVF